MREAATMRVAFLITLTSVVLAPMIAMRAMAQEWGGLNGPVQRAPDSPLYLASGAAHEPVTVDGRYVPVGTSSPIAANDETARRLSEVEAILEKWAAEKEEAKKKAAAKPSVQAGGRIHWDWAAFNQDSVSQEQIGRQVGGSEFRKAKIFLKGEAFEVVEYKAEYDFADSESIDARVLQSTAFKDVYIQINELPLLRHVRVVHFKEPFGLEQLTSSNHITFMERSLADEGGFVPGRNSGVMAHDTYADEYGTWAIGCFFSEMISEPPVIRTNKGGLALTMRGTYLPLYDEATDGRRLWHLGVGYSYRDTPDDLARFRQRPECHLADYIVDTRFIPDVPSWQILGAETAYVNGPFSVQAEWNASFVARDIDEDLFYHGGYVYFSYFLTGEHRVYNRNGGCFDRVEPFENFFRVRDCHGCVRTGKGAWELAYRCSFIDLSEFVTLVNRPGRVWDHTIGINWYLNPYTRVMFNYVNSTLNDDLGDGSLSIFQMRTQIDF